MNYISTRGRAPKVGFVDALLAGLAPDGGLYVPEIWPGVPPERIAAFAALPYADVAAEILGLFAGEEVAPETLARLTRAAYGRFSHQAVAPLRQIAPGRFLLELFHGPTLAFKDLAMQILAELYDHILTTQGRTMTIVCATSGDTGGAAVDAFRGRAAVSIVTLFPEGRISEVQRRFMTTAKDANVRNIAVAGDFDDCQAIVKALFQDAPFAASVGLSGVNSINFVRIAAQSVYYFTAAAALGAPARPVGFITPTGNFGDAFAGWVAWRMGLPVTGIVAATNQNDIVARALQSGLYRRGAVAPSRSPAMDIQVASNFERLYFAAVDEDAAATEAAFQTFAREGALTIPGPALARMRERLSGVAISEAQNAEAMRAAPKTCGETVDPHTAIGLAALAQTADRFGEAPVVVLSTAHAAKFPEAALEVGSPPPTAPPSAMALSGLPERFDRLPARAEAVKAYIQGLTRP
jgi:threonine synthase